MLHELNCHTMRNANTFYHCRPSLFSLKSNCLSSQASLFHFDPLVEKDDCRKQAEEKQVKTKIFVATAFEVKYKKALRKKVAFSILATNKVL